MAQQGKGNLIRVGALLVVLIVVGGGFLYMRQAQGGLNSVEKIESYVNGGGLLRKSLDEVKAELDHNNPRPKEGEQGVYLFDMTERDPKLTVVVEVVVRNNVVAGHRTYDMQGRQTGTQGATDGG